MTELFLYTGIKIYDKMNSPSCLLSRVQTSLFSYETPKVVIIESRVLGILNRFMKAALFVAVIAWVFVLNNGYQYIDGGAIGGSTSKIKGVASSNSTDPRVGHRIWDSADLQVPPQENGAFFLTTNIITTRGQAQGRCPEVDTHGADCESDEDCLQMGQPYHLGHGISTGHCDNKTKMCEVEAWCPVENDAPPEGREYDVLNFTQDFTVMIKNHVHFPYYDKRRSNLVESLNMTYLYRCHYNLQTDPYCPIFRIGDMVSWAHDRDQTTPADDRHFKSMAAKGGVISVKIKWDCNFDYDKSDCKPEYSFNRLDNDDEASVSQGYNFRYPLHYMKDGVQHRHLVKAYGILFLLTTEAKARAFDTKTLLLNIGSSIGLLGIATILSELVLVHLHKNKEFFKQKKIEPTVTFEKRQDETANKTCLHYVPSDTHDNS